MPRRRIPLSLLLAVHVATLAGFAVAAVWEAGASGRSPIGRWLGEAPLAKLEIPRREPLRIDGLYDDPQLVGDEQLMAVLRKILPRFENGRLKPNHIEHALRTWHIDATFDGQPGVLSGAEMAEFLTDHGRYLASWGDETAPLLSDGNVGVVVRWGRQQGASVHHDHWLASLTEAGMRFDDPVVTPTHRGTFGDVLRQALWDFRLDERETEWSAMAFGLWLPPTRTWVNVEGRRLSFDLLARRLMRGDRRFGVCSGTHRVYSLVLLLRLDDEFHILSADVRRLVEADLEQIRDLIIASQWDDGRWPSNWWEGIRARETPLQEPMYKQVIATGHHLEWLAIAPERFHPPRDSIRRAARWVVETTLAQSDEQIRRHYTFYSHVGNALALWRKTTPIEFWRAHAESEATLPAAASTSATGD